jgi:hypothetical protein
MKKNVSLALLLCMLIAVLAPLGVCAVDTASDGKSIDIYLIAGQSNASGTSKVSDASAAYLWAPELRNGYSNIHYAGNSASNTANRKLSVSKKISGFTPIRAKLLN